MIIDRAVCPHEKACRHGNCLGCEPCGDCAEENKHATGVLLTCNEEGRYQEVREFLNRTEAFDWIREEYDGLEKADDICHQLAQTGSWVSKNGFESILLTEGTTP